MLACVAILAGQAVATPLDDLCARICGGVWVSGEEPATYYRFEFESG